jgi:undecaprenyl phosphate-alpha-L-ara4FN deformylase
MQLARNRFQEVFAAPAQVHGAAGWQMNVHAFRRTQRLGFHYASDTRGRFPYLPVVRGEIVVCPQVPTTLPTLDELIGLDATTEANVADKVLGFTDGPGDQVFTLHAEMEGMKLAPVLERLLDGWKQQGRELVGLGALIAGVRPEELPLHTVVEAAIPGRSGTLATQGPAFLGEKSSP